MILRIKILNFKKMYAKPKVRHKSTIFQFYARRVFCFRQKCMLQFHMPVHCWNDLCHSKRSHAFFVRSSGWIRINRNYTTNIKQEFEFNSYDFGEAAEKPEEKQSFFDMIKAFFSNIIDFFKNLFSKIIGR